MSEPQLPTAPATGAISSERAGRLWWLAAAALALAGIGLVLLSTAKYGAGVWLDSVDYFDVARSLMSGRGFVHHSGSPYVWWPPLYPMLLAGIGFATRLDPAVFAHIVNAILFALTVYLSALLFRVSLRQATVYSMLGVCAVLLSVPLSGVYAMALSESLFIPLVLIYLISAQRYWDNLGLPSLAVMASSAALACLTRYIGITLVLAGFVTVILTSGTGVKTKLARAFAFAALSLLPIGAWVARNYFLSMTLVGDHGSVSQGFASVATASAKTIILWFVPSHGAIVIVPACASAAVVALVSSRTVRSRVRHGLKVVLSHHLPAVLFLMAYLVTLSITATRANVAVGSRMLSPLYVPAVLVLLEMGSHLTGSTRGSTAGSVNRIATLLLALWLCFPLTSVALSTARRYRDGAGFYSTRTWRESETLVWAKKMATGNGKVRVYSNGPDALWELGRVAATKTPSRFETKLGELAGRWPTDDTALLVWFDNVTWGGHRFTPEELGEISDVEEVARLSDGAIYRASSRGAVMGESGRRINGLPRKAPSE